jgi:hypothetical protein
MQIVTSTPTATPSCDRDAILQQLDTLCQQVHAVARVVGDRVQSSPGAAEVCFGAYVTTDRLCRALLDAIHA